MPNFVPSYAKINLGLKIGPRREDGFHELRTVYQTIGLHDRVKVELGRGTGIEIRSKNGGVPCDESNTCYRMVARALKALRTRSQVTITIDKKLPVEGGVGGASSNAAAALFALERALKMQVPYEEALRLAAEVGSDVPLFLVGGLVLGAGRGEEVYPLPDLPPLDCVVALPGVAIATAKAFAQWDEAFGVAAESPRSSRAATLTASAASATMMVFSRTLCAWLKGLSTGVPGNERGGRAEALLLDLVRTGIENDFERVVFPQYPELREVKRALEREGAAYASLSGSGSALYGLFASPEAAEKAASRLVASGVPAEVTRTVDRREYWGAMAG
jgi:4-diphosphocytidyl-2-C-methyl-D-erythritol kinase